MYNCGPLRYDNFKFFGGINAVNLADVTASGAADTRGGHATKKAFIFGRSTCYKPSECDVVQPTASYAALNELTDCGGIGSYSQYFNGGYTTNASNTTPDSPTLVTSVFTAGTAVRYVQNFPVTSDVIPVYSHALEQAGNQVPLFLLTRGASGNSSHGFWGGSTASSSSISIFQFFTTGSFTN